MDDKNPHAGSTLEGLLRQDGTYEDVKNDAVKSILARKLREAMKEQNLSKTAMAKRMRTSPPHIDR